MTLCKRILAGLTFLICAAMLLLSLAGGVGVWTAKERVRAKAAHVFERVEAALDLAEQNLDQVNASLARAAERLDGAREEQRTLAQQPQQSNVLRRKLARTVQGKIAPEIGDAHEKLHTVAEAAVVVNAVLEDVSNFPFLSVLGLDIDGLTQMNTRLTDVGPAAWELSRLLGDAETNPDDAGTQFSRVDQTLRTMRGLIAQYQPQVMAVRRQTEQLKSRTLPWITPASIVISAACFWIALSQVSLMFYAWSWWRGVRPLATR